MTSSSTIAYRAGRAARLLGRPIERCPYPANDSAWAVATAAKRIEWQDGWIEQDADMRPQQGIAS